MSVRGMGRVGRGRGGVGRGKGEGIVRRENLSTFVILKKLLLFISDLIPFFFFLILLLNFQPPRTPLQRFRAIATTVKHNLLWARLLAKEDNEKSFVVKHEDGSYDQSMTFNVNAFKSNVQTVDSLPSDAKRIMTKNQWGRTPAELKYLQSFIGKVSSVYS